MKRYYPSGYRKKKKRENVQRLVVYFAIAIIVGGVAILAGWAVVKMFKPGTPDQGTNELANAQAHLEQLEGESQANLNPAPAVPEVGESSAGAAVLIKEPEQTPILLADIKDFEQSFPEIGVMLLSSSDGAFPGLVEATMPEETTGETLVVETTNEPDADTPPAGSARPGPPVSRDPEANSSSGSDSSLNRDSGSSSSSGSNSQSGSASNNTTSGASNSSSQNESSSSANGSGGASGKYIYTVYAGSWKDKDTATRKLDELAGVGYAAQIVEIKLPGSTTYRVLVKSKVEDYGIAKEIQADLKAKGFTDASIYKDKPK